MFTRLLFLAYVATDTPGIAAHVLSMLPNTPEDFMGAELRSQSQCELRGISLEGSGFTAKLRRPATPTQEFKVCTHPHPGRSPARMGLKISLVRPKPPSCGRCCIPA